MKPLSPFVRRSCQGLAAAIALQVPLAQAELIGPEAVLATQTPARNSSTVPRCSSSWKAPR